MGTIVEFSNKRTTRPAATDAGKKAGNKGDVVFFPGVRYQRGTQNVAKPGSASRRKRKHS